MLFVNREQYREMVRHRQKVCPKFAKNTIDEAAIHKLLESAVPDFLLESAQDMPEAANVQTTMHEPANRIPTHFRRDADIGGSDTDAGEDNVESPHAGPAEQQDILPSEPLNANETVIGIGEDSCPKPLRLFEAWTASMSKRNAAAAHTVMPAR